MRVSRFVGLGLVLFPIIDLRGGSRMFDEKEMGYTDEGAYVFDTAGSGSSNSGHDYGTNLSDNEKADLMEYLKTL